VWLAASRTTAGSGLGLSLVAAIAVLHRFSFEIEDNSVGSRVILKCWIDAPVSG
jgi:signal transduction histidine kinase